MLTVDTKTGKPVGQLTFDDPEEVSRMNEALYEIIEIVAENTSNIYPHATYGIYCLNKVLRAISPTVEEQKLLHEARKKVMREKFNSENPGLCDE